MDSKSLRTLIVCATVLAGVLLLVNGGLVLLGHDDDSTIRLALILVSVLGVGTPQYVKLHKIEKQTNGQLHAKLDDQTDEVVSQVVRKLRDEWLARDNEPPAPKPPAVPPAA